MLEQQLLHIFVNYICFFFVFFIARFLILCSGFNLLWYWFWEFFGSIYEWILITIRNVQINNMLISGIGDSNSRDCWIYFIYPEPIKLHFQKFLIYSLEYHLWYNRLHPAIVAGTYFKTVIINWEKLMISWTSRLKLILIFSHIIQNII